MNTLGLKNNKILIFCLLCFTIASCPLIASAATGSLGEMNWGKLVMGLLGGLAIFLYGMERMSDALKIVAGERMKEILAAFTNNRIMGVITGTVTTAIIQSSSVTTVLLVGFVTAGLMSLAQTIGVIFGANIGTTITAQIIAFKVTKYALALVTIGFCMFFFSGKEKVKQYGYMIMGLGLVFYGMAIMSGSMKPLRSYQPFLDLMLQMSNPFLGILVGAAFTALVQSSSATTGVVIVMAMQGLISLEAGIALAFGANIGTCVTAGLASIGKTREAVRVFVVHTVFNVVGVLVIGLFIPPFAELIRAISPEASMGLSGQEILAAEVPRQIANAHTIFNVAMAIIFLPFTTYLARFANWIVPDRAVDLAAEDRVETRYMHDILLKTPPLALDAARSETQRMGERVAAMCSYIMPALFGGSREELQKIREMDEKVDILHGNIVTYLGNISKNSMGKVQSADLIDQLAAVNDLERIGDIIQDDLYKLGLKRIEKQVTVSEDTRKVLTALSDVAFYGVKIALEAMEDLDPTKAEKVLQMDNDFQTLVREAEKHQASRLIVDEDKRLAAYSLEIDMIDKLKRVFQLTRRMARTVNNLANGKIPA